MPAFRKKPVVIEAIRAGDIWLAVDIRPDWVTEAIRTMVLLPRGDDTAVRTPNGEVIARPEEWIIRGVKGELYPCDPDIFDATYEAVT